MGRATTIEQVGENAYIATIPNAEGRERGRSTPDNTKTGQPVVDITPSKDSQAAQVNGRKFARWGGDNRLPLNLMKLGYGNNLVPGSMDTKNQIALGDRLIFYYERYDEDGKITKVPFADDELQDWLDEIGAEEYLEEAIIDYDWYANFFAEFRFGRGSQQQVVRSIRCVEAMDTRSEVKSKTTKSIMGFGVGDWNNSDKPKDLQYVRAYDPANPYRYAKVMMHLKKKSPGNPYYPLPSWIGAQEWVRHANKIPTWKTNNMDNSLNVRWHIEYPERYFLNLYPEPQFTREEREKKKKAMLDKVIEMLSGVSGTGKTFTSGFSVDKQTGKTLEGWKLTPLKPEINHEAYSKDFEDSNSAIMSAMGIDPSLTGILIPGGKLSSGSEKRLSHEFHAQVKTRFARKLLLKPLQIALKISGFSQRSVDGQQRRVRLGIQDVKFTTLDKNPTGSQNELS